MSCRDELEAIVADQMGDVVRVARDEVVEADDVVPFGEKPIAEMRAEEARRAGDEDSHDWPPRPIEAVGEAERRHLPAIVQVPAVDHDGALQRRLDAGEVGMPVLVPVGDDDERVGAGERVVVRLRVVDAVAEAALRLVHRDGIVRDDRRRRRRAARRSARATAPRACRRCSA